MAKDEYTQSIPVAICPKCQTLYPTSGNCTVPTCKSARLLKVQTNNSRVGDTIDGKFTLLEQVGKGGMGTVYRGLQHNMERQVALKLLNPSIAADVDSVKRFLREAKQASILNHPHIITLFDFGQSEEGDLYLVMELLEGIPLSELIHREGHLPPKRAVNLVKQACEALQYAHSEGIIHRDLKPDNLFMVTKAGQTSDFLKVLDFGLAKVNTLEPQHSITATGIVCGTPAYMSPEQALSKNVDRRSDIYSMGIILYEMLSGSRPFGGDSPVQMLMAHVNSRPPTIRESDPSILVPKELEAVLMGTLAKDPAQRPPDARTLSQRLHAALGDDSSQVSTTPLSTIDSSQGVNIPSHESMEEIASAETMVGDLESLGLMRPRSNKFPYIIAGLALTGLLVYFAIDTNESDQERRDRSVADGPSQAAANQDPRESLQFSGESVPLDEKNAETTTEANTTALGSSDPEISPAKKMELITKPSDALITIDGAYIGETPHKIDKPTPGEKIKVTFSKKGYQSMDQTFSSRSPETVTFTLKKKKKRTRQKSPKEKKRVEKENKTIFR